MKPGIYHGVPIEEYHGTADSVSKSGLDDLHRSPAHFFALHLDPDRPEREETAAQLHGNLAHCAILEPDEFPRRYVTVPKNAPRRPTPAQWAAKDPSDSSKAAMAWWSDWNARTQGATDVTADQYDAAMRQRDSVFALQNVWGDLSAGEMLAKSATEVSAYWKDPATGVPCRCRPDAVYPVNDRQVVLLDVKTFGDARPREFSRQVASMRYHVQDAFYSDGYGLASGMEVLAFIFLVVEDKRPFAAAAYRLGEESRYEGLDQSRQLLELYEQCKRSNAWPGYAPTATVIDLPPYALTPQEVEISYV